MLEGTPSVDHLLTAKRVLQLRLHHSGEVAVGRNVAGESNQSYGGDQNNETGRMVYWAVGEEDVGVVHNHQDDISVQHGDSVGGLHGGDDASEELV